MRKNPLFQKQSKYAVRRLSVGVASVVIGCGFFGSHVAQASDTTENVTDVSSRQHNSDEDSITEHNTVETDDLLENKLTNEVDDSRSEKNNRNEMTDNISEETSVNTNKETTEYFEHTVLKNNETNSSELIGGNVHPRMKTDTYSVEENSQPEISYDRRDTHLGMIDSVVKNQTKDNVFDITYRTGQKGQLSFYNNHVIRYHIVKNNEEFKQTPEPSRPDRPASIIAKQLEDYEAITRPNLTSNEKNYVIQTDEIEVRLNKEHSLLTIFDKRVNRIVLSEAEPLELTRSSSKQTLYSDEDNQYFGGGTQNGRFTHKGHSINIVNENNWVDKGVASPNPFYWTTGGYGMLRHTFRPGRYDFEETQENQISTIHQDSTFDAFYFINQSPVNILKDYYELTGKPVVLPVFALYEGHLNAYNRDTWVEVPPHTRGAVYFEETGKWYLEYPPNQLGNRQGHKETLNGNPTDANYPFTAMAVVDRYKKNDMPLGWILVNDGYGAGYGQEDSLAGNIQNLKRFAEYAKSKGVLTGLWTQSDLHPNPNIAPLLQRDLPQEVEEALVRVLKTDVAWVGPGYSFGLNGIADAANIMKEKGNNARPFIITLDGWGGTQRYGGIWTGDQTGGQWEYIRFHIPTYIGTGLSGQPNVSSDMDGIFGGGNKVINIRDFQWKTFTPLQLNMDGWGTNPKTPFAFDTKTTDLNRMYLKMKSALVPYSYSIGHQAANGKPMIRAMFLDFPNEKINYTKAVQYQFMYGDSFLIAPIYENTQGDEQGNDIRNGIYLPEGAEWIDYFTGKVYKGGQMLNNFDSPIWKLPIFVKKGAIIPVTNEHNNYTEINHQLRQVDFYPSGNTAFQLVEDDGLTNDYLNNKVATTQITSQLNDNGTAILTMHNTNSRYDAFVKEKVSQFNVNVSKEPTAIRLYDNNQEVTLRRVSTLAEFESGENVYFYDERPNLNKFSSENGELSSVEMIKNPMLRVKSARLDVTQHTLRLELDNYELNERGLLEPTQVQGDAPIVTINDTDNTPTSVSVSWTPVNNVSYYEVEANGIVYTNIKESTFTHNDLQYATPYHYRVRAAVGDTYTDWSELKETETKANPLENAIDHITVSSDRQAQPGTPHSHLVDRNTGSLYHSAWHDTSVPETIKLDLKKAYDLDKLEYVPRNDGGLNGIITNGKIYTSIDGNHWTLANDSIAWSSDSSVKILKFNEATKARFVKFEVTGTVGGNKFVSGQEIFVYRVPNSKGSVVGDVTGDGHIDSNDLTSFTNYAGLRRGIDSDFEGYVEVADLNKNDVIDAYDIYYATRQIGEGSPKAPQLASGNVVWQTNKTIVNAGEELEYTLVGKQLTNVEAIYANLPIDLSKYEVVGSIRVQDDVQNMINFSTVRTHGNGEKEAFVILANQQNGQSIHGDKVIAKLTLRALASGPVEKTETTAFVVGSDLQAHESDNTVDSIESNRIQVSGNDDVYQNGYGLSRLTDNNLATVAELKWDYAPNYVNGRLPENVTLPQDIQFDFTKETPTYLHSMAIYKRTPGNGTLTKYKVSAYRGENKVYESTEIDVPFAQDVVQHQFDKVRRVDKVILTVLEARTSPSTINNKMLTLKEVAFYEKTNPREITKVPSTQLNISGKDSVYQNGYGVDKLIDNDDSSLTELKWDYEPNYVNGKLPNEVTLPQKITINTENNKIIYFKEAELFKRTPGNGTVTKYKLAFYRDNDKVYETQEINTPYTQLVSKVTLDTVIGANKVVLSVLEARTGENTINNRMMTLKELKLYEIDEALLSDEELQMPSILKSGHGEDLTYDLPRLEMKIEEIPFDTIERINNDLPVGERRTVFEGANGRIVKYIKVETNEQGEDVRTVIKEFVEEAGHRIVEIGGKIVTLEEPIPNESKRGDGLSYTLPKLEVETVIIPFETQYRTNNDLPVGEHRTVIEGKNGKTLTYIKIETTQDGQEIRTTLKEVTQRPVHQVVEIGIKVAGNTIGINDNISQTTLNTLQNTMTQHTVSKLKRSQKTRTQHKQLPKTGYSTIGQFIGMLSLAISGILLRGNSKKDNQNN